MPAKLETPEESVVGESERAEGINTAIAEESKIKSIIQEIVGSSLSFDIITKNSEIAAKSVSISRELKQKTQTSTVLFTNIEYTGKDFIDKFMIYDEIPKSIASNINEVKIYTPSKAKYQVIEKDPKILIIFDNVTSGETNTITYLINKPLDETVVNDFKTPTLFVKSITVSKEAKVETKKGKYNWVWYVVGIVVVLFVLIYIIAKKKNNKPNGNNSKKR